jgi:murein DD-endopeptidase MepM/ murein hydrolase activator NlpD
LLVSVTVPASALVPVFQPSPVAGSVTTALASQSMEVDDVDTVEAQRGTYTITAPKPTQPQTSPGNVSLAGSADGAAAPSGGGSSLVRWPLDNVGSVSDGFGPRLSPCAGCSSQHMGTDFVPGLGAQIYAIAAGTVSVSTHSGGYGQHVFIDHVINGQSVRSLYAHLQAGSSPLFAGQHVEAGAFVGLVGTTGAVTGPHLHHEILVNGSNVDPYAWLSANAG